MNDQFSIIYCLLKLLDRKRSSEIPLPFRQLVRLRQANNPSTIWRRRSRRIVPLAKRRGLLCPLSWHQSGRATLAHSNQRPALGKHSRPQSGDLLRAQDLVSSSRRKCAHQGLYVAVVQGRSARRGLRCHCGRLGHSGACRQRGCSDRQGEDEHLVWGHRFENYCSLGFRDYL